VSFINYLVDASINTSFSITIKFITPLTNYIYIVTFNVNLVNVFGINNH